MLDAFKGTGSKREEIVHERQELERLIEIARAERSAIDNALAALKKRSAGLTPIGESLDTIADHVNGLGAKLDVVGGRVSALDSRTSDLEELDERVAGLTQAATEAEQIVQSAIRPDGEIDRFRSLVAQLTLQGQETQDSIAALNIERAAVEGLRSELRTTQVELKQSVDHAAGLERELNRIRGLASSLTDDYARVGEASRIAREDTAAAMTAIKEIEKKLGPLTRLHELGQNTEERLASLNALAERVSLKAKLLEGQQPVVERALVQTNRVNEMVWAMELQIGKLNEGMKQAAATEETLTRLETLSEAANKRLEGAAKLHDETEFQSVRLEKRGASLLESMHAQVERLAVDKKEIEAVAERMHAVNAAVDRAEARISAFANHEKALSTLEQKVDGISKRFEVLVTQSDELTRAQLTLDGLHDRLAEVNVVRNSMSAQMDWLRQRKQDLDGFRKDVEAFRESQAEIQKLNATLAGDRQAIQELRDQMAAVSSRAPEVEAKVDAILAKVAVVEQVSNKVSAVEEFMQALDGQISRVESRSSFVGTLEERLNGLHALSSDIDHRLEKQLDRQSEFDKLQSASDGLAAQVVDAQHKLEALNALQARFRPLIDEVQAFKIEIDSTRKRLEEITPDHEAIAEQERRFAELASTSRSLATELIQRTHDIQALGDQLASSGKQKDTLIQDLDTAQALQSDILGRIESCEDQLARTEKMFKQLEERRVQIAVGEKKLAAVEARLADITQANDALDRSHQAIADREQLVNAIKAEVETVHQIGARSKADLEYVMEQRGEVTALKMQIEDLSSQVADTDERIVSIDSRRQLLDEVEKKANFILNLVDDMRINVETIEEQKAVVDDVAQTVAQLESRMQEARSTLNALQRERELAERIEQGIRQRGLKSARSEEEQAPV